MISRSRIRSIAITLFQDEILARMEGANQPTQQMLEPRDHGENLSLPPPVLTH
jgi:hypothetical protein